MTLKKFNFALGLAVISTAIIADEVNNVGSCGWGSKLMENNRGIAPQVLAVTTNGTFGNQTFGITSGTSGCTQDGVVTSNWIVFSFIESNKTQLAHDISRGHGEGLEALIKIIDIAPEHKPLFKTAVRENFTQIFTSEEVTAKEVILSLEEVLRSHSELDQYASRLS